MNIRNIKQELNELEEECKRALVLIDKKPKLKVIVREKNGKSYVTVGKMVKDKSGKKIKKEKAIDPTNIMVRNYQLAVYAMRQVEKIHTYYDNGYCVGDNLILTSEGPHGEFDVEAIERIVANIANEYYDKEQLLKINNIS